MTEENIDHLNYSGDPIEPQAAAPKGAGYKMKVVIPVVGSIIAIAVVSWVGGMAKQQAAIDERENQTASYEVLPTDLDVEPAVIANLPSDYSELIQMQKEKDAAAERRRARLAALESQNQPRLQNAVLEAPQGFRPPPRQVQRSPRQPSQADQLREQELRAKIQAENAAKRSPIGFGVVTQNAATQSASAGPVDTRLAAAQALRPRSDLEIENGQADKQAFLNRGPQTDIYNPFTLQEPISENQIMAGSVIPAQLISGLNSDLPGKLVAQVRENVYDTVTGTTLLIPQGTRVIGDYSSAVTFGQSRALVVWERIIFPSGRSINLQNFPGVDLSGFAGFKDKVNNHTLRIISSVVLGSLVAAGTEAANGGDDELQVFVEGVSDGSNRAVDRIVQRNLSIQPTLEIRPGYRFNVFVHSDIVLPAYDAS